VATDVKTVVKEKYAQAALRVKTGGRLRSAAAIPPRSPNCTRERLFLTWDQGAGLTCCFRPRELGQLARRLAWI